MTTKYQFPAKEVAIGIAGFIILPVCLIAAWYGWWALQLEMNLYAARKNGEAALLEAEQTKKIAIETAKAELESAKFRADAVKIMGEAAKAYPEYRQQEFIGAFGEALREGSIKQIVYIPTECGIPLMEAGRREAE